MGKKQHYVLIKDFDRMMFNISKSHHRKYFCTYCLQHFTTKEGLNQYKENCLIINGCQAIKMPNKGKNIVEFKNYHKQMLVPSVIYVEFEAITEKVSSCQPDSNKSYTDKYKKHTGCSYGYKLVCCYDDKYPKPVKIYRGEDSIRKFMEQMLLEVQYCRKIITCKFKKPLVMSEEEAREFQASEECNICGQEYRNRDGEVRVRDYCHITGKYRGSAHQDCNLKLRISAETFKLPVIFHNLRGYDSHFIMQEIGAVGKNNNLEINCILNNMEK